MRCLAVIDLIWYAVLESLIHHTFDMSQSLIPCGLEEGFRRLHVSTETRKVIHRPALGDLANSLAFA